MSVPPVFRASSSTSWHSSTPSPSASSALNIAPASNAARSCRLASAVCWPSSALVGDFFFPRPSLVRTRGVEAACSCSSSSRRRCRASRRCSRNRGCSSSTIILARFLTLICGLSPYFGCGSARYSSSSETNGVDSSCTAATNSTSPPPPSYRSFMRCKLLTLTPTVPSLSRPCSHSTVASGVRSRATDSHGSPPLASASTTASHISLQIPSCARSGAPFSSFSPPVSAAQTLDFAQSEIVPSGFSTRKSPMSLMISRCTACAHAIFSGSLRDAAQFESGAPRSASQRSRPSWPRAARGGHRRPCTPTA